MKGVIGPVSFDKYGDITGPFRFWKIVDGKVTQISRRRLRDFFRHQPDGLDRIFQRQL